MARERMSRDLLGLPRALARLPGTLAGRGATLLAAGLHPSRPLAPAPPSDSDGFDDPAATALELACRVVSDRRAPGDAMRAGDQPVTGREPVRALSVGDSELSAVPALPHGSPPDRRVVVVARRDPDFTSAEVARVRALLRLGTELDLLAAEPPPVGAAYPHSWRRDAVLADGTEVQLRPVRPGDAALVAALHARCSPATVFARFLSPVPRLPGWMLSRLVDVDHVTRVAFVAVADGDVVGLGSWSRSRVDDEPELALLVEDAVQGKGLGPLLVERLFAAAAERGVPRLHAVTSPDNASARSVLVSAGFSAEPSARSDGLLHLTVAPATALARPA